MTTTPKTSTETTPAQREAEGVETVDVTWRDRVFTIPASLDEVNATTLLALEEGKAASAVRGLIGPRKFTRFVAEADPSGKDLGELLEAFVDAMGLGDAGE